MSYHDDKATSEGQRQVDKAADPDRLIGPRFSNRRMRILHMTLSLD